MRNNLKKKGFTIVELVIVIAVIAILAAILVPTFVSLSSKASKATLQSDLLNSYKMYSVDAVDGYVGDADQLTSYEKENLGLKNVEAEYAFLSSEKNPEAAVNSSYVYKNRKWEKADDVYLLNSVCMSFAHNAPKYGKYYVFYGEVKPSAVAVNPASFTIPSGASLKLDTILTPKSATKNGIKWKSSDASVTVDENGTILAAGSGSATITAWFDDNDNDILDSEEISGTSSITVGAAVTEADIVSIEAPDFVSDYIANTTNLSSVSGLAPKSKLNTNTNTNSSYRNTFFKNEDGTRDVYKVGVRNAFEFNCAAGIDLGSLTEAGAFIADTASLGSLIIKEADGTACTRATVNGNSITFDYSEFLTGEGDTFQNAKLKLIKTINGVQYPFDIEVFDGYNVYDEEGLALFDNTDLWYDKIYFNYRTSSSTNAISDPYASRRHGISSNDVKGLAIHCDLKLTDNFVPDANKYSEEQVDAYINANGEYLRSWADAKNSYYKNKFGDDYSFEFNAREELIHSLIDDRSILTRTTNGEDFVIEGNYFSIDASEIKPVYAFGATTTPDPILNNKPLNTNENYSKESHLALFGFNLTNNPPIGSNATPGRGGNTTFNNLSIRGNAGLFDDERYCGGLIFFKSCATTVNFNNVISSNSYIAFMNQLNYQISTEGNPYANEGAMNLDRVKSYSSYNMMYYSYGGKYNNISNSYVEDAGGPLLCLDEKSYGDYLTCEYSGSGDFVINNTHLENYVQGTEFWFASHQGSDALFTQITQVVNETGWLGKNSASHGQHKNILSFADNKKQIPLFNLIGFDFTGAGDNLGNNATKGIALTGSYTIDDYPVLDMDSVKLDAASDLAYYANVYRSQKTPGMIFATSAGGHGMFSGDPGDGYTNIGGNTLVPYFTGETTIYNVYPGSATFADKLASGNYMTLYLKAIGEASTYNYEVFYNGIIFGM